MVMVVGMAINLNNPPLNNRLIHKDMAIVIRLNIHLDNLLRSGNLSLLRGIHNNNDHHNKTQIIIKINQLILFQLFLA
jgi:hypothetical protein